MCHAPSRRRVRHFGCVFGSRTCTPSSAGRAILAIALCFFLTLVLSIKRSVRKDYVPVPEKGIHAGESYYVSKNALCSHSIAYEQLNIQPIAVSKVILRPLVNVLAGPFQLFENCLLNDIAFLDRNVTGNSAELNPMGCPIHTVSILHESRPFRQPGRCGDEPWVSSLWQDQDDLFHLARKILSPQNWGIQYRFGETGRFLLVNGILLIEFLRPSASSNCDTNKGMEGVSLPGNHSNCRDTFQCDL
jgi:hypothetical protein